MLFRDDSEKQKKNHSSRDWNPGHLWTLTMRPGQSNNNMEEDESDIYCCEINKNVTECSLLASRKCEKKFMVANLLTINLERLTKCKLF